MNEELKQKLTELLKKSKPGANEKIGMSDSVSIQLNNQEVK